MSLHDLYGTLGIIWLVGFIILHYNEDWELVESILWPLFLLKLILKTIYQLFTTDWK